MRNIRNKNYLSIRTYEIDCYFNDNYDVASSLTRFSSLVEVNII